MLAVSGQLDRTPGTTESSDILWKEAEVQDAKRGFGPNRMASDLPFFTDFRKHSLYLPVVRNMQPEVLSLFDVADPNAVTTSRNETTVPSQSRFLLNSRFLREQSPSFAERLQREIPGSDDDRIHLAHHLAFGRPATETEVTDAREFLHAIQQKTGNRITAWQSYCQILLCQNEFLYCQQLLQANEKRPLVCKTSFRCATGFRPAVIPDTAFVWWHSKQQPRCDDCQHKDLCPVRNYPKGFFTGGV